MCFCHLQKSVAFTEQMMALLQAQQNAEERYISARNESLTSSLAVIDEAQTLAAQSKIQNLDARNKLDILGKEFDREHKHQVEKLLEAKTKAVGQFETDNEVVSQATDRIKSYAEKFVNAGKDAWNNHYERTESELRKKSDDSSAHVKEAQTLTADVRGKMLETQSKLDAMLESQRRNDERNALSEQSVLASRCQETKDFGAAFDDQFKTMGHALHSFVNDGLKKDVPTGHTPMRTIRQYPKEITQGTPDNLRLDKYRSKREVLSTPSKFNMDNINGQDDVDSVVSVPSP